MGKLSSCDGEVENCVYFLLSCDVNNRQSEWKISSPLFHVPSVPSWDVSTINKDPPVQVPHVPSLSCFAWMCIEAWQPFWGRSAGPHDVMRTEQCGAELSAMCKRVPAAVRMELLQEENNRVKSYSNRMV